MAVYVDPLTTTKSKSFNWRHSRSCHLYADTVEELHQFAAVIGLKQEWFKNQSDLPHYRLMGGKRRQAIEQGAETVTSDHLKDYIAAKQKENRKRKRK